VSINGSLTWNICGEVGQFNLKNKNGSTSVQSVKIYPDIVGNSRFTDDSLNQRIADLPMRHFVVKRVDKRNMGSTAACFGSVTTILVSTSPNNCYNSARSACWYVVFCGCDISICSPVREIARSTTIIIVTTVKSK